MVNPRVSLDPIEPDARQYLEWRRSQVGFYALPEAGLSLDEAVKWHERLALTAQNCDPIKNLRKLLRHVNHDDREKLKDQALRAHTLYDTAEVLRRYLERYHWRILPDEADVGQLGVPGRNLQDYGSSRPADFNRRVLRRTTRRFGVDPGYRVFCFVEGSTEIGYMRRWVANVGVNLDRVGVRLVNLKGIGNVEIFEDQLRRLREDEVFAIVCIDRDHPQGSAKRAKHIGKLEEYQEAGLLPVDFTISRLHHMEPQLRHCELHNQGSCVHYRAGSTASRSPSYTHGAGC